MNVIVKGGDATRAKVLSLFQKDAIGPLVQAMTNAIFDSFETASMRNPTQAEKKRRFSMIMEHVLVLRAEHKWGVQRICDAMPDILKTELSGAKWKPDDRQCWIKSDGG